MFYEVAFHLRDHPTVEDAARQQQAVAPSAGQWVPIYPRSADLLLTPVVEQRATEAPAEDWEILATAIQVKHPEWPARLIARCVGVHRGTLYRSRMFTAFRDRMREAGKQDFLVDLPRGTKEVDPDDKRAGARLEAWSERDDDE
jgi:hypothetical protein